MKKLFFLCTLISISTYGQNSNNSVSNFKKFFSGDSKYTPSLSTEFQALKHQSFSLGIGAMHPTEHCDPIGRGIFLNNEYIFKSANGDKIYSPQLSVFYTAVFLYGGLKLSYYTNLKNGGNLEIAPEIGLGYVIFFVTYSRNISIINNDLIPINKDNISFKLLIPFGYFL